MLPAIDYYAAATDYLRFDFLFIFADAMPVIASYCHRAFIT